MSSRTSSGTPADAWSAASTLPNRVILTRDARPGQTFQLAVFGINGPISASPRNYIWMRTATLDFSAAERAPVAWEAPLEVEGDPSGILPVDARLERVAGGFEFTEGPVWARDGALLFSSPNTNSIYRWTPNGIVTVFRSKSGYTGVDAGRYHQSRLERAHLQPRRPADAVPARQPPRDPGQPARRHHRARRSVRGQAAEQPERPRLPLGRRPLLHRPAVRAPRRVRRSGQGARLQRRLPRPGRPGGARHRRAHRARTGSHSRRTSAGCTSATGTSSGWS